MEHAGRLSIRPIGHADIATVYEISEQLSLSSWSHSDLVDELERKDSLMLLAMFDNHPVGFIIGRQVPGADEGSFDAEIYNIGVLTRAQKNGIGSQLLGIFLDGVTTNNTVNVWLEVRAANLSAIKFYRRHGFEEIATRKGFYSDPTDDAIVMKAEVSQYHDVLNKESLK